MRDELYHYGVLGMKWGVRRYQPYPKGRRVKGGKEIGAATKVKQREDTPNKSSSSEKSTNSNQKLPNMNQKFGSVPPEIISLGASTLAVVGVLALEGALINHAQNKAKKSEIKRNKGDKNFKDVPKKKTNTSEDEDMKAINPGYANPNDMGARMNCVLASTTYEMRRRGYDVTASKSNLGRDYSDVMGYWNLSKKDLNQTKTYDKFKNELNKMPNNTRGTVMVGVGPWDSKHAMVWEKKNGNVIIRDCQSGEKYNSLDSSIINQKSKNIYTFFRTDNATPNESAILDALDYKRR